MAGAAQPRTDQAARPRAEEGRLSNSNKVVRLPLAQDAKKTSIADGDQRRQRIAAILARLVENDIVPRLLASLPAPAAKNPAARLIVPAPATPVPADAPTQDAVEAFADTLLKGAAGEAASIVARLRGAGVSAETLCLHLLTGAARHLGDLWVADIVSFSDVTLATDQLQLIFRGLAPDIEVASAPPASAPAALLVTTPGEQHSFGLSMLAAFFRASGWSAQTPRIRNAVDVQRKVASAHVDLVGFSLGSELHLTRLGRCIELARRSSCNPDLVIMVGGPAFIDRPDLASVVGADATASDAASALAQAERLIRPRRP